MLVLSGGVGGAKLVHGFSLLGEMVDLSVAVNVGDDFEHLGLSISPDIDTVIYTLAGIADADRGWGLADESWRVIERLDELGCESWFRLGDKDLATHLYRTEALRSGRTLSEVTRAFADRMQLSTNIFPATDDRIRTQLRTDQGLLDFQDYFVRCRCEPIVTEILYKGADNASPAKPLADLLDKVEGGLDMIVLAPSNPFLSLAPILSVNEMCERLRAASRRIIAVSPIVGGRAIKGPTVKLMVELGWPASAASWAEYMAVTYPGLIDEWIFDGTDEADATQASRNGLRVSTAQTVMRTEEDRAQLAKQIVR